MTRNKYGLIILIGLFLGALITVTPSYSANQLTGEKILQKMDERESEVMGGSLITYIHFETENPDGTTSTSDFRSLGKSNEGQADKTLIYFLEPKGFLFLAITPEEEDSKLWTYGSFTGLKRLESEQEREGSFAGSALSFEDIGQRGEMTEDYRAETVGEETLAVEGDKSSCYVLKLRAKEGVDVDYPVGKVWISKNSWLMLKSKFYNRAGNLELSRKVLKLGEFEGSLVADQFEIKNLVKEKTTTITFTKRKRPDKEIPDSVFDGEKLPEFDPAEWGFSD